MILANRSGRVLLEVQHAELTAHPDIIDNIAYSVQFGEQILHGNHRLSHRDLLNPVFNETLEFALNECTKMTFRLSCRGLVLGEAEILLMSSKCLAYITTRNRKILGTLYYSLKVGQTRELLRHTRGAESENYAGSGMATHSNGSRSKMRDKSQELRPKQLKTKPHAELAHSPQLSDELFSSYFQKKTSEQRELSEEAQMQVSIDPRDKEVLQKRKVLETELLETARKLEETRAARKQLQAKVKGVKRQLKEVGSQLGRSSDLAAKEEDSQTSSLIREVSLVESYNRQLRRQLASLANSSWT